MKLIFTFFLFLSALISTTAQSTLSLRQTINWSEKPLVHNVNPNNIRYLLHFDKATYSETKTPTLPVFKARVVVTNRSSKLIKSVSWTAILTQPGTNDIISEHYLTSRLDIAPGKTKKVTQKLQIRPVRVVNAANLPPANSGQVADLKVAVTEVTYADGSTSKTP